MKSRSFISITLIVMLCAMLSVMAALPSIRAFSVSAADPGEILIDARAGGEAVKGMKWYVYYLGSRDDTGKFGYTDAFSDCGVELEELTDDNVKDAAAAISAYIKDKGIAADYELTTDENGEATISDAESGVYFIEGESLYADGNTYVPSSALAELFDGKGLNVIPKIEIEGDESNGSGEDFSGTDLSRTDSESIADSNDSSDSSDSADTSTDSDTYSDTDSGSSSYNESGRDSDGSGSDSASSGSSSGSSSSGGGNSSSKPTDGVPQTGQLWWPVPVLSVCGLVLIALGLRVAAVKGKDDE